MNIFNNVWAMTKVFLHKTFVKKDDINSNTKIALAALLIAVFIVFDRFANIRPAPFIRLSFATVPVMVAGYILGIKWAVIVGALGDMLGALFLMPFGNYFFGFTLNWVFIGLIFGFFLYRKRNPNNTTLAINMVLSSIFALVLVQLFLASYWLYGWFFSSSFPYWYIFGFRAWTFAIVAVLQVVIALPLCIAIKKPMERFLITDDDEEDEEQNDKD